MKRNIFLLILLSLLGLVLSACIPLIRETESVTPMPTLALPPTATDEPATAVAGSKTPTPTGTAVPIASQPTLITQEQTNVRLGPGMSYGVSQVLSAGTTAPIIGKNLDGTWWAVPGPGDGPGPPGWVPGLAVTIQGDTSNVPILAAPTLPPPPTASSTPDLPLMENPGSPQRIQFEPGAISAIVDGELHPPQRDMYLFRALAGQMAVIEIHSTDGQANFMLSGVGDGQPYKRLEDEQRSWSGHLPLEQDYLLTVAAPADAAVTEYSLQLLIEPLNTLPTPSTDMEINSFLVTSEDLPENGKRLTFQWETSGGASARILSGSAQRFQPYWDVPLSGEMTVDLLQTLFRDPAMTLELQNAAGESIFESAIVEWDCTNAYYFTPEPRRCPHPATAVAAVVQDFEHGWMVWLENVDGNGRRDIFALYNDGTMQTFTDTWQEGDPEDDPTLEPPPGLFQPVRGFGKVWREQSGVRERLGWAINLEQGFQATMQIEKVESIPSTGYLELLDGRVIYLPLAVPFGNWEQVN